MAGGYFTVLSIDPGSVHTGVVLSKVVGIPAFYDRDVLALEPVNGTTAKRSNREGARNRRHLAGLREYATRIDATCTQLLDLHGINRPDLVCIESLREPATKSARVTSMFSETSRVLGFLEGVWTAREATLWTIPPAGTCECGQHSGFDAASHHEWVPAELSGRRPRHWLPAPSGVRSRNHELSSYAMGRTAFANWWRESAARGKLPPTLAQAHDAGTRMVEATVARIQAGERVTEATVTVAGRWDPWLAAAAADQLQPGAAAAKIDELRNTVSV